MNIVKQPSQFSSLLYSSQFGIKLSEVYKKIAVFVINLCKKDYNFIMHTC